jgi:hypothetical protein
VISVNPDAEVKDVSTPITQPTQAQVPAQPTLTTSVTSTQESTMDRNQHMIAYFGRNYGIEAASVRNKVEKATSTHESALQSVDDESVSVNAAWSTGATLQDLVINMQVRHLEDGSSGEEIRITQNYGFVSQPIFSRIDLTELFNKLFEAANFNAVQESLTKFLDGKKDTPELHHALSAVSAIDRILTQLVNQWLKLHIATASIAIDSFTQDVVELSRYLHKTFDGKYNSDWQRYQAAVTGWVFKHLDDDVARLATDDMPTFTKAMAQGCSILYIDAISSELGYERFLKEGELVTSESDNVLYRLLDAARSSPRIRQQETMASREIARPIHYYLVTQDGACYQYARLLDTADSYRLIEV